MAWVLNDPPPKFWEELAECQRYQNIGDNCAVGISGYTNSAIAYCFLPLPVTLRGNPTLYGKPIVRRISDTTEVPNATVEIFSVMEGGVQLKVSGVTEQIYLEGQHWGVDCNI